MQPCHEQTAAMPALEALSAKNHAPACVRTAPIEGGLAILQHGIAATAEREGERYRQSCECSGSACKANTTAIAREIVLTGAKEGA